MHMSNYMRVRADPSDMATRESGGVGMNHLTVVPENLEIEPAVEEERAAADDDRERATGADDGDAA